MDLKLKERLNSSHWSLIIDETTDVSVQVQLVLIAQHWKMQAFRLDVSVIELVNCPVTTADGIVGTICKSFDDLQLNLENFIGFSADTYNVMFGCNHSVSTLLRAKIPDLLTIKCSCHSIHKCSQYASVHIPKRVEDVVRGVCTQLISAEARSRGRITKNSKILQNAKNTFQFRQDKRDGSPWNMLSVEY